MNVSHLSLPLLLATLVPALYWLISWRNRRLLTSSELVRGMECGHLDQVDRLCAEFASLIAEDDRSFVSATGGKAGIRKRRRNSVRMVQICQRLHGKGLSDSRIRYMLHRATLITLCTNGRLVEACVRWFVPGLPHLCVRVAGVLYRDMAHRMTTICEELAPELLPSLTAGL